MSKSRYFKTQIFITAIIVIAIFVVAFKLNIPPRSDEILPPQNENNYLFGKWELKKASNTSQIKTSDTKDPHISTIIDFEFAQNYIILGNKIIKSFEYSVKTVGSSDYFRKLSNFSKVDFYVSKNELRVFSIFSGKNIICEFVEKDLNNAFAVYQNNVYSVHRKSAIENVNPEEIDIEKDSNSNNTIVQKKSEPINNINSGLLLGFRYDKEYKESDKKNPPNILTSSNYKMLWITFENDTQIKSRTVNGILFPRRSGFWTANINKTFTHDKVEDTPIFMQWNNSKFSNSINSQLDNIFSFNTMHGITKKITFLGNDFVSFESNSSRNYNMNLFTIDSKSFTQSIDIADIEDVYTANMIQSKLSKLNKLDTSVETIRKSIGIVRNPGRWVYKAFNNTSDTMGLAVDLNFSPTSKLIAYDKLWIKWQNVKDQIPQSLDVFTSPNKDIAVVLTSNKILVYRIVDGFLEQVALYTINIKEGYSIFSSDWALEDYVQQWDQIVKTAE